MAVKHLLFQTMLNRKHDGQNLDLQLSLCSKCCILFLGDTPVSELYVTTFRSILFHFIDGAYTAYEDGYHQNERIHVRQMLAFPDYVIGFFQTYFE
jgi:hypothetical protein